MTVESPLVQKVIDTLQASKAKAATDNKVLSARKLPGACYVVDELEGIEIGEWVFYLLSAVEPSYKDVSSFNLAELINVVGSLKKACIVMLSAEEAAKHYMYEDHYIDYLRDITVCINVASTAAKTSKSYSKLGVNGTHFQEYCSFCWRLVNKYELLNFSISDEHSNHLCKAHNSVSNEDAHKRAKRALIRSIEAKAQPDDIKTLKSISAKEYKISSRLRHYYKFTHTFASKPSPSDIDSLLIRAESVQEQADVFLSLCKEYYPAVAEKLELAHIKTPEHFWIEWFKDVISALDDSETDISSWQDTKELITPPHTEQGSLIHAKSPYTGLYVLLNIAHRYQAYTNIQSTKKPPGPQKSRELRDEILKKALHQISSGQILNMADIARQLDITRQRVGAIIKELRGQGVL